MGENEGKLSKNTRSGDQEMCTINMSACEGQAQNPAQPSGQIWCCKGSEPQGRSSVLHPKHHF